MTKNYNTFLVVNCKSRNVELVTSSARKAYNLLAVGFRVDVWNGNTLVEKIYANEKSIRKMIPYKEAEREYIGKKQKIAELRNARRFERLMKEV